MDDDERAAIRRDFADAVTMTPRQLQDWPQSSQSRSVGVGEGESVGHRSGRRIVALRRTKVADLTDDDHDHMRTVVGYVRRHLAQRPSGDVTDTPWRWSLMNWGHDPLS